MNPKVTRVQALNGHQLLLEFSNAEVRLFDVSPFLEKGIFRELQEQKYFKVSYHEVRHAAQKTFF